MYTREFLNNKLFCNLPMAFDKMLDEPINGAREHTGAIVHENGDVTFRIYAPESKVVRVRIVLNRVNTFDFSLKKGNDGFFQTRLENDGRFNGPLNVNLFFDGTRLLYPYIPIYWSAGSPCNYVEFPDPVQEFAMVKGVPHGAVSHQVYYSKELGSFERCLVYTPPGYMNGKESYPVLYLQHGGGENETVWESTGKLSSIMDNLISTGQCVPFIVVMNNGMVRYPDCQYPLMDRAFEDSLLGSCIPFIEANYRVRIGKWNRAIGGLSMGSYTCNDIALGHPELFGYVAAFTGCMYHGGDKQTTYERPWEQVMKTGDLVKEHYRVFFQSATPVEDYINYVLEDNRICVDNGVAKMPGYRFIIHPEHTTKWSSWRMGLRDYAKLLFREEPVYQNHQALQQYG